jgi:microcystin-dependent protein
MTYPASSTDNATSYVPPITRTSFATPTTRALAGAMTPTKDPSAVQRRWATVAEVYGDGTVDIILDGVLVESVLHDASYQPGTGDNVFLDVVGPDVVVMGTIAPSLHNPGQRRGTVTAISIDRLTVDVTLDNSTTLISVPVLDSYDPVVGDDIYLSSYQGQFLALGTLGRPQQHRATVTSISADRRTVNLTLDDGVARTGVAVLASYDPVLDDSVHVLAYQGQPLVIGSLSRTPQTYRRAVGDIEPSLTVKPGTLSLSGQTVSRTAYPQLWSWVQTNNLVVAGMFGAGDGTTTFVLPDFRGKTLVGTGASAGLTWNLGTQAGSNNVTLATNQMPAHDHNVAVAAHATHTHAIDAHATHSHAVAAHGTHDHSVTASSSSTGSHSHGFSGRTGGESGHNHGIPMSYTGDPHSHAGLPGTVSEGPNPRGTNTAAPVGTFGSTGHDHAFSGGTDSQGTHSHTISVDATAVSAGTHSVDTAGPTTHSMDAAGPTTHTVTESIVGGTTPVDVRQPSIAVHYVVWT